MIRPAATRTRAANHAPDSSPASSRCSSLSTLVRLVSRADTDATHTTHCTRLQARTGNVLLLAARRAAHGLRRDASALNRILADDLRYVHGNASVQDKKQFIDSLKSGDLVSIIRTSSRTSMFA